MRQIEDTDLQAVNITKPKSNSSKWFVQIAKIAFAAAIIAALVWSGKLDFSKVTIFYREPHIFGLALTHFFIAGVVLAGLRWWLLMRAVKVRLSAARGLTVHWIGQLFNNVLPGALGGDLVKAVYVIREDQQTTKTTVLMSVLLDRIFGMAGLFILAGIGIAINFTTAWHNESLRPFIISVFFLVLIVCLLLTIVFLPSRVLGSRFADAINAVVNRISIVEKIFRALRCYHDHGRTVIVTILISLLLQAVVMGYFWVLLQEVSPSQVDFFEFVAVFPLGVLVTALPLAPGGIGVGHLAFDRLFSIVGIERGADVFNLYILGTVFLSLSGILPYLLSKRPSVELSEELNFQDPATSSAR
jgi:glycosyltransferase 2 family protein